MSWLSESMREVRETRCDSRDDWGHTFYIAEPQAVELDRALWLWNKSMSSCCTAISLESRNRLMYIWWDCQGLFWLDNEWVMTCLLRKFAALWRTPRILHRRKKQLKIYILVPLSVYWEQGENKANPTDVTLDTHILWLYSSFSHDFINLLSFLSANFVPILKISNCPI